MTFGFSPPGRWRRNRPRSPKRWSKPIVRYEITQRRYDHEPLRDAKGFAVLHSHRESVQQDARLTWKHYWDTQRRWRATTKLAAKQSEDNGSGYFNYTKLQAGEQILFRTKLWEISAEAKLARYD